MNLYYIKPRAGAEVWDDLSIKREGLPYYAMD